MALLPEPGFHFLPRNGRDAPRIQFCHSAGHFRLPSGFMITIRFDFQALQEQPGQDGPVFLGKTQGLLDHHLGVGIHGVGCASYLQIIIGL
jgi:hypothetical protein